ncbi:MAG TPA: GNVR domain-containing protein, partial [Campylobacterales bacterium]|nr:GNVR domain-containing protein [Campylobacterales bacterium]
MYSNNQNAPHNKLVDEMDLKEIFALIYGYKKSIIAITALSTCCAVFYLYTTTKVYQADSSLKIQKQPSSYSPDDLLAKAFGLSENNLDNEMIVLQSRQVMQRVAEKLHLGVRYFSTGMLKTKELYTKSPFVVDVAFISNDFFYYDFYLHPVDENRYRLVIEPTVKTDITNRLRLLIGLPIDKSNKPSYSSEVFAYNSKITNKLFSITVKKVAAMDKGEYIFRVVPNEYIRDTLQGSLKVRASSDKSSILNLSYTDNVPQRAEEILNTIVESYQQQSLEAKTSSAKKVLSFVDEQLDVVSKALKGSATELEQYKSSNIVVDPQEKAKFSTQRLNILEMQYYELNMQEEVFAKLQSNINANKGISEVDTGSLRLMDSPVLPLVDKLREAELVRAPLLVDYTDKHPAVIKATQQVNAIKANLKGTIDSTLKGIRQRKANIDEFMKKQNTLLQGIPKQEQQLSYLANSFTVNQKIYEYLLRKRAEMAIAESSPVSEIFIIDKALADTTPVRPKSVLVFLIGVVLGIVLGILQAIIRSFLSKTIKTPNDIEKRTPLPIYGILPSCYKRKSQYEEALRILLTRLEYNSVAHKPRIITFIPSVFEDTNSATAIEFAKIIAKNGKRVILLDFDTKTPTIHKKLRLDNSKGVSSLLSGASSFKQTLTRLEFGLDVITSGELPDNPHKLITSGAMRKLLEILGERYDYIIIEASTGNISSDSLAIMFLSDFNLIVFKTKSSKK